MISRFYDAHNHLQDAWLACHLERVLSDLASAGVTAVVVNGTSETDWSEVAALCAGSSRVSAGFSGYGAGPAASVGRSSPVVRLLPSFGLHPWDVGNRTADWERKLAAQLEANPRAFVGEIGLDRWILERARPDDPRLTGLRRAPLEEQLEVFRRQLALAVERDVPATIHCLDAFGALYDALRASVRPRRGFLLHAYSGPVEMVAEFAKLGAYFSFNGAFLDPTKKRHRAVYTAVPPNRLLVETDAPAMSLPREQARFTLPDTAEGTPVNHPANVVAAYAGLTAWRGLPLEELAAQVEHNFETLFGASTPPSST